MPSILFGLVLTDLTGMITGPTPQGNLLPSRTGCLGSQMIWEKPALSYMDVFLATGSSIGVTCHVKEMILFFPLFVKKIEH